MRNNIKIIEDLSLNAWPSHQMQIYDGWILRFSYFYTHRTNCIEQIGPSSIPLEDKLDYCEEIYRKWGTPAIYKINPLLDSSFDQKLTERGYHIAHITEVMAMSLMEHKPVLHSSRVILRKKISPAWLNALFNMKGTANQIHRTIVPSMYAAIPKDTIAAYVYDGDKIIGTGLGILDRDYIGLYAIHVDQAYRGHGLGHDICQSILDASMEYGAASAYLQVVKGNAPAKHFTLPWVFRISILTGSASNTLYPLRTTILAKCNICRHKTGEPPSAHFPEKVPRYASVLLF